MRDKEIRRILGKVEKAWRKDSGKRLIDLLLNIEKDPDPRLDSRCLSDAHLEALLDSNGRAKKNRMTVSFTHIFTMSFHSISHEDRAEIENFIRTIKGMTVKDLLEDPATQPMVKMEKHYAVKLQKWRVVFQQKEDGVELMDVLSEASIKFFNKAFRAQA